MPRPEAAGETVRLGVLEDSQVTVVSRDAPDQAARLASGVGERLPFHATALGKSIAAYLDPAVQRRLLESSSLFACTPETRTSVAALRADLDLARARGYAIEIDEHAAGSSGVAVSILDHSGRPTGVDTIRGMDSMVSLAMPRARGGLVVAAQNGIFQLDFESGRRMPFAHPEEAHPANRYNDGKCDRRGRLWVGSLDMGTAPNRGSLFRVDPDGNWLRMDSGFTISNGLGFSPDDKRMYFADSGRRTVYVYDYDVERGEIAHRRPFVELADGQGVPDGLTVDAEGFVWLAVWDGWTVIRYDPEGRVAMRLPMPVPRPTSCCFGGADMRTLYITTASVRLPEQALADAPLSGALFACTPGATGLPETAFAG